MRTLYNLIRVKQILRKSVDSIVETRTSMERVLRKIEEASRNPALDMNTRESLLGDAEQAKRVYEEAVCLVTEEVAFFEKILSSQPRVRKYVLTMLF